MIVRDILGQKPPEMALVQGDDVVEQIAPAAAHPAFRDAVLPRAPESRPRRLGAEGFHRRDDVRGEDGVPIEDEVPRRRVEGERPIQFVTGENDSREIAVL